AMKEAGIVAVSDDGKPIATAKLARQVMDYCRSLDLPVIEHSEDVSLAAGAAMREGVTSTRLGLPGMPAAAEAVCVARDVQLIELTGARLHVAHLSAKASLEQVRWAKSRGLRVTCAVTPPLVPLALAVRLSLQLLFELFCTGPACVLGMERNLAAGQRGDLAIFASTREWTSDVKQSPSKSPNSPFDGRKFKGGPAATIVAG